MTHNELVLRAEKWLSQQNCKVIIRDECRIYTKTGEQPDAIGWRDEVSILIECKTSRSDFLADKLKSFRSDPMKGMGDWRFYLCLPGVIFEKDLPDDWGLLWALPKTIKKISGYPANTEWFTKAPFRGNKDCENSMLVSALRRLTLLGYLPEIYEGYWKNG